MTNKELFLTIKKKKKILLALIIIGIIMLFGFISIANTHKNPDQPISSTINHTVLKIGQDVYSKNDHDYLGSVYLPDKNPSQLSASDEATIKSIALERSIVIQEAMKNQLIPASPAVFTGNKNWPEYNKIYEKAKQAIIDSEEHMSLVGVFMYFYNQFPPAMGVDAAKTLTHSKMEKIHTDLVAGRLTMQQAGEQIKADSSLAAIDSIYRQNAYVEIPRRNRSQKILDGLTKSDSDSLWLLKEGEYSPILLGTESGNGPTPNEAYFGILQVVKKAGTQKPYLQWLEERKKVYGY